MFQFNIVFGILVAFLSNYIIGSVADEQAWRWMLGVEAVPALIYSALCLGLPEDCLVCPCALARCALMVAT